MKKSGYIQIWGFVFLILMSSVSWGRTEDEMAKFLTDLRQITYQLEDIVAEDLDMSFSKAKCEELNHELSPLIREFNEEVLESDLTGKKSAVTDDQRAVWGAILMRWGNLTASCHLNETIEFAADGKLSVYRNSNFLSYFEDTAALEDYQFFFDPELREKSRRGLKSYFAVSPFGSTYLRNERISRIDNVSLFDIELLRLRNNLIDFEDLLRK